jgi:N-acetylmuramoyl-L-alanine amidase
VRRVDRIIIHCSATQPSWMYGSELKKQVAEIRRWHVEDRGWSDIGYHHLIGRDGSMAPGRPITRAGAHTKGLNMTSIGVCLIGGHGAAATDAFEDHFTEDQKRALVNWLKYAMKQYKIKRRSVSGHNQHSRKGCPGFSVPNFIYNNF